MSRLHDALLLFLDFDQVVSFAQVRRQRFLDEQIESRVQQLPRHLVMLDRRHGHARCIELQVRLEQCIDACEHRNAVELCCLIGTRRIRIDRRNQRHARPLRLELAQHTQMVAPKGSGASHGHAQLSLACDFAASFSQPFPSTAFRQRL